MKNLYIVVNPMSGNGTCLPKLEKAVSVIKNAGVSVTELHSKKKGEMGKLVKTAVESGADCVAVVGGDGTMQEAVGELVKSKINSFLFPFGTGNDFAHALGLTGDPVECAKRLLEGSVSQIDVGMVNESYFLNVAGLGFDVEVLQQTDRYKNRFTAKNSYIMGLIHAISHLKAYNITMKYNDKVITKPAFIASFGNGQFIGGGMHAHPKADISDGLLDICMIEKLKLIKVIPTLLRFMKGKHLDLPVTTYDRSDEIEVTSDTPLAIQLDGEINETTPAIFKLLPKALNFIM